MRPRRRIIPLFVPHLGCPHACVFCNQREIAGRQTPVTAVQVRSALEQARDFLDDGAELAFYGGSFTAIAVQTQLELLEAEGK